MSVLLIAGPKCTLAASRWVTVSIGLPTGQTDRQTDGRQTATVRFPLEAASVINKKYQKDYKELSSKLLGKLEIYHLQHHLQQK